MRVEEQKQRAVSRGFLDRLEAEVQDWQRLGIVTPEQGQAILGRYVVISPVFGRLIVVLATLGALLVGLGIILLVASNWQAIPSLGKLALLLAAVLSAYGLGYWLKYHRDMPRVGGPVIFLGALLFGASIFLIGQQYHMRVDDPNLLTWWFLGVVPLAYLTRSQAILALSILAAGGMTGYRANLWLEDSFDRTPLPFIALYLTLSAALYAMAALHSLPSTLRQYARTFHFFALAAALGALYLLTFRSWYGNRFFDDGPAAAFGLLWAFMLRFHIIAAVTAALAVGAFVLHQRESRRPGALPYDLPALLLLIGVAYWAVTLPAPGVVFNTVAANLVFASVILGVVYLGYRRSNELFVNLGLAAAGLDIVTRYFDFGWELLPRSLFFIAGGVILLAAGFALERFRRRLMARMRAEEVADDETR